MKNKQKNLVLFLASLFIFIVGVGIFIYPFVSNFIAEMKQREVITSYDETLSQMTKKKVAEEWKKAEVYNDNLAGNPPHDPFVVGSGYAIPDNYYDVLNIDNDGVMGYIDIPKIDVHLPIYHGTSEEILQKGAGHLEGSSLPIGGINRFSVISAHRGLPSAELFTRLDEMEIGDVFYIHILDQKLTYQVDSINVINPEELSSIQSESDKDLVTLLTCTPYAVNTHRLLVRGIRISTVDDKNEFAQQKNDIIPLWLQEYLFAIPIGIGIVIFAIFLWKRKNKRENGKC